MTGTDRTPRLPWLLVGVALVLVGGALLVERDTRRRLTVHSAAQARWLATLGERNGEAEGGAGSVGLAFAARDLPEVGRLLDGDVGGFVARLLRGLMEGVRTPTDGDLRGLDPSGGSLTIERDDQGTRLVAGERELRLERGDVPTALTRTASGAFVFASTGGEVRIEQGDGSTRRLAQHTGTVHALAVDEGRVLSAGYDEVVRASALDGSTQSSYEGHEASVQALASIDGARFASGDVAGHVLLWDDGVRDRELLLGSPVRALQFLASEESLAILLEDGRLVLWRLATGATEVWRLFESSVARGLACDGRMVAILVDGRAFDVDAGRLSRGGARHRVPVGRGPVQDLAFSPVDARTLVLAGADGRLRRVAVDSGEVAAEWHAHRRGAAAVALAADGRLASAGADGKLRIFDGEGTELQVLLGHARPVRDLAWIDGGLVSVGLDGSQRFWPEPLAEPTYERAGPRDGGVQCFALDRSGERLAWVADGGNLRVWGTRAGERRNGLRAPDLIRSSEVALDGATLAVGTRFEEGQLTFFDEQGRRADALGFVGSVAALALSPAGEVALAANHGGEVLVFDPRTGDRLLTLRPGFVADVLAVSDDGGHLAVAGSGQLALFELAPEVPE